MVEPAAGERNTAAEIAFDMEDNVHEAVALADLLAAVVADGVGNVRPNTLAFLVHELQDRVDTVKADWERIFDATRGTSVGGASSDAR